MCPRCLVLSVHKGCCWGTGPFCLGPPRILEFLETPLASAWHHYTCYASPISWGFRLCLLTSHYLWVMDKKLCFANEIAAKCELLYEFLVDLFQIWIDVMGQSARSSAALVANIRLNLIVIAQRTILWLYSRNIKSMERVQQDNRRSWFMYTYIWNRAVNTGGTIDAD